MQIPSISSAISFVMNPLSPSDTTLKVLSVAKYAIPVLGVFYLIYLSKTSRKTPSTLANQIVSDAIAADLLSLSKEPPNQSTTSHTINPKKAAVNHPEQPLKDWYLEHIRNNPIDPSKSKNPVGIKNEGNDCFLITAIQLILLDPILEKALIDDFLEDGSAKDVGRFLVLYRKAQLEGTPKSLPGVHQLRTVLHDVFLPHAEFCESNQGDASEVIYALITNETTTLYDRLKRQNYFTTAKEQRYYAIPNGMRPDSTSDLQKSDNGSYYAEKTRSENFTLNVGVQNASLKAIITDFVQEYFDASLQGSNTTAFKMDGGNVENCSPLYNKIRWSQPEIPYLMINLNRWKMSSSYQITKVDTPFSVGEYEEMPIGDKTHWMQLTGFSRHHGAYGGGHWLSYTAQNGRYTQNNDDTIKEISREEFLKEAARGVHFFYKKAPVPTIQPEHQRGFDRFSRLENLAWLKQLISYASGKFQTNITLPESLSTSFEKILRELYRHEFHSTKVLSQNQKKHLFNLFLIEAEVFANTGKMKCYSHQSTLLQPKIAKLSKALELKVSKLVSRTGFPLPENALQNRIYDSYQQIDPATNRMYWDLDKLYRDVKENIDFVFYKRGPVQTFEKLLCCLKVSLEDLNAHKNDLDHDVLKTLCHLTSKCAKKALPSVSNVLNESGLYEQKHFLFHHRGKAKINLMPNQQGVSTTLTYNLLVKEDETLGVRMNAFVRLKDPKTNHLYFKIFV